ncbi:MAG TPA: helix-turn-helix domain-containing protein [Actinocrinis sp.]|uniref:helix-turn-helix domain-containing protein n=1 Tax=Actinocrinis sp. TaxID=1920516 RepID=UPI002DDCA560|nr:helix-turn-helix domain-containing protein [Actinocrinis sp.]HEV3170332.1 helix-turn-helix domain-containing protein [Actinocrinis sp.]
MRVFTAKGFRPAGVSDVATELGLSHGAVYTYADSKQALLYLALLRALDPDAVDGLEAPVATPQPDEIVDVVRKWAARDGGVNALADVLDRPKQVPETPVRWSCRRSSISSTAS